MTIYDSPQLRNELGVFEDRRDAGQKLAALLATHEKKLDAILAVPAGGVPVAVEMGKRLQLPVDVAVVSKATFPWTTEAGFGAVAFDSTTRLNEPLVRQAGLTDREISTAVAEAKAKVERRVKKFHRTQPFPELRAKNLVLVDDGLASGFTMQVAVEAVCKANPARTVVAVPTAHASSLDLLQTRVDAIYCCNIRRGQRFAVAAAYLHWRDVTEQEAVGLIAASK